MSNKSFFWKKTESKQLNGVLNFLGSTGKFSHFSDAANFLREYCKKNDENYSEKLSLQQCAIFIQIDFVKFVEYTRTLTNDKSKNISR